ncbi:MAG: HD-GYP domain-containing protein [Eubacterium sp.]|nr:HD-GYP domain-containing protein [Eubacterium sp.]
MMSGILWFVSGLIVGALIAVIFLWERIRLTRKKSEKTRDFVDQMIRAFARLIDAKDEYTQGHSLRVALYTEKLARRLGFTEEEVRRYKNIAFLHDIGKVAIPDKILHKPEGLTDEEYEIMKSHTTRGKEILDEITVEGDLAQGAGYHHERFDGGGYPEGLRGDEIPPVAQLIAVADTFDAMYSTRPYRSRLPLSVALQELESIAGSQLNETYVKAFIQLAEEGELSLDDDGKEKEKR